MVTGGDSGRDGSRTRNLIRGSAAEGFCGMSDHRVTTLKLEYPGDGLHYLDGEPFTGVLEFPRPDGHLEGEEEYKDGLLSGLRQCWYESGQLQEESECAWGGYHGQVREWHENGQLASRRVYAYGIKLEAQQWDESGALVGEYRISDSERQRVALYRAAFEGDEDAEPGGTADGGA